MIRNWLYEKILCKKKQVCLTMDGAKDINGRKLISVCVVADGVSYLLDIVDFCYESTDQNHYSSFIKKQVDDVEKFGCKVVSFTMDNEPAEIAGLLDAVRNPLFNHITPVRYYFILYKRCSAHVIELLANDLNTACPPFASVINQTDDLIKKIKNNKNYLRKLRDVQKVIRPNQEPLQLIKCNNTRKWYASYLQLSRVCELSGIISQIEDIRIPQSIEFVTNILQYFRKAIDISQSEQASLIDMGIAVKLCEQGIEKLKEKLPNYAENIEVFTYNK